jgi:hypothetical protein
MFRSILRRASAILPSALEKIAQVILKDMLDSIKSAKAAGAWPRTVQAVRQWHDQNQSHLLIGTLMARLASMGPVKIPHRLCHHHLAEREHHFYNLTDQAGGQRTIGKSFSLMRRHRAIVLDSVSTK